MSESPPLPASRPVPLGEARAEASRLLARLERNPSALRLAVAGAARRMAPWVERLDLLATAHEAGPLIDALLEAPRVAGVLARHARGAEVRLASGLDVRLEVRLDEAEAVPALVRTTGPAPHVALLEARARALGLEWSGDLLRAGGVPLALFEEGDLYDALGLEPLAPELRESLAPGALAEGLLGPTQVQGAAGLYVKPGHGRYPLADMAARAEREGYAWSLAVVPAADPDACREAEAAAAGWNAGGTSACPVRLALEVETADGAAGPPQGEAALWLGHVEVGSGRDLERARALTRAVDALCLSFPASPEEAPAPAGLRELLGELAARRVAWAVAPPPHHPRPEPALLAQALDRGVPLLLLARARDLLGVDDLALSVGLSRRAGARADQVLNALPLHDFDAWLAARRAGTS